MQSNKRPEKRLLDDLAKLAGSTVGVFNDVRKEVESLVKEQCRGWAASMDMVSREEFEAVKKMASLARQEQEKLENRLAELEKRSKSSRPAIAKKKAQSGTKKKKK